jgi:hypothetical protein
MAKLNLGASVFFDGMKDYFSLQAVQPILDVMMSQIGISWNI